jgi:hypothetical protein
MRSSKVRSISMKSSVAAKEQFGHMVTVLCMRRVPSETRPGNLGQRSDSRPMVT